MKLYIHSDFVQVSSSSDNWLLGYGYFLKILNILKGDNSCTAKASPPKLDEHQSYHIVICIYFKFLEIPFMVT